MHIKDDKSKEQAMVEEQKSDDKANAVLQEIKTHFDEKTKPLIKDINDLSIPANCDMARTRLSEINKTFEEKINPLIRDISDLSRQAETINFFNFLIAPKTSYTIHGKKRDVLPRYDECVDYCYKLLEKPYTIGQGSVILYDSSWYGLTAIFKLQDAWRDLGSTLDRKDSLTLAMLALYVAVVSLVISFVPLFLKATDP